MEEILEILSNFLRDPTILLSIALIYIGFMIYKMSVRIDQIYALFFEAGLKDYLKLTLKFARSPLLTALAQAIAVKLNESGEIKEPIKQAIVELAKSGEISKDELIAVAIYEYLRETGKLDEILKTIEKKASKGKVRISIHH